MGRIVKGPGRVIPAQVLSAKAEAAELRAQAQQVLAHAQAQADAIRAEAERSGYQAGFSVGRDEGLAQVTETLVAACAEAEGARSRAKDTAITLARRMAEKIIGRAIDLDPTLIGAMAGQALVAARARGGSIVLRIHPEDLAALESTRHVWTAQLVTGADVRLVADESVGRHGCVVETSVGRLDARLDTQLAALERALARASGSDRSP